MATTKKKPVTKATVKKPAAVRKPATKPAVKATSKGATKVSPKKIKTVEHRSFRPSKETTPFMTFQFTRESLYWLILSVLVLALGAWVMYLNVKIQNIYDQVELNTQLYENYTVPKAAEKAPADTPVAQ